MRKSFVLVILFTVVLLGLEGLARYATHAAYQAGPEDAPRQQEAAAPGPSGAVGAGEEAAAQPSLALVLAPPQLSARVGEVLTVRVLVQNPGGQPLDGVQVSLYFDPAVLEVVDSAGTASSAIVPGGPLADVLLNRADNSVGRVDYAAGRGFTDPPPSGNLVLATILFRAKSATARTVITVSAGERVATVPGSFTTVRETKAAYRGERVPMTANGAVVAVTPAN